MTGSRKPGLQALSFWRAQFFEHNFSLNDTVERRSDILELGKRLAAKRIEIEGFGPDVVSAAASNGSVSSLLDQLHGQQHQLEELRRKLDLRKKWRIF